MPQVQPGEGMTSYSAAPPQEDDYSQGPTLYEFK